MSKTATVRAMIDPQKKAEVEKILKRIGINHSEAINIYYSLIAEFHGLPFELRLPDHKNKNQSSLNTELISHLKKSIKLNHRLGELLAK
jgi:addiction module RelB/DinJ family antitoxin